MKNKETLEEAAESYGEPYRCPATNENEYCKHDIISAFNNGAKWQAERMYSEEDMKQFGLYLGDNLKKLKGKTIDEIFEQFKKK